MIFKAENQDNFKKIEESKKSGYTWFLASTDLMERGILHVI